jgi:hypothetical protein
MMELLIMQFSPSSHYFFPLQSDHSSKHPVLNKLSCYTKSEDPTYDINKGFQVELIKPTFLLQTSYKSCVLTVLFIIQNNYKLIRKQSVSLTHRWPYEQILVKPEFVIV